jgi:ketosteroid isomerase-like protein
MKYAVFMATRDFSAVQGKLSVGETPSHQQVLLAVLQAVAANDFASVPEYFTEDAELHIHGFPNLNGIWRGRANVAAAMAVNFGKVTEQKPVIQAMIPHGDVLAVRLREKGRFVASRLPYDVEAVIWCTFADGKIAKVEEFVHRAD